MIVKSEVLKKRIKVQLYPTGPEDVSACNAISQYSGIETKSGGMIEIELLRVEKKADKIEYEDVNQIAINDYIEGES